MLDRFANKAILIAEIESIADMDLRDIHCLLNTDLDDSVMTIDKDGHYIWDTVGKPYSKTLEEIRIMLDSGYTAIPF